MNRPPGGRVPLAACLAYARVQPCPMFRLPRVAQFVMGLVLLLGGPDETAARAQAPVALGSRLELFTDDLLVGGFRGCVRRLH